MSLLLFYLGLALGVSFLCSLVEASLLSVPVSHGRYLTSKGHRSGPALERMKENIDRPLAAILTLNTISHTIGAAGVGAQAVEVFGDAWVAAVSAVLTLLILILSEIIPKTLGATYARPLAPLTVTIVQWMIWVSYPIIIVLDLLSKVLRGGGHGGGMTREQLAIVAELARAEGALEPREAELVRNALALRDQRVHEVMTPRTVVFSVPATMAVSDVAQEPGFGRFSRIPVLDAETPSGVVHRYHIYEALRNGRRDQEVGELATPLLVVPESARLTDVMEQFGETGQHMFQVVDEYGAFDGVITLEDVLETMLGHEIVDETDYVRDMRALASSQAAERGVGDQMGRISQPPGEGGPSDDR